MVQGKCISADIGGDALHVNRGSWATRPGVHVQTIGRIEAGEPGVAIGHVLGLLALYGIGVRLQHLEGPET